MLAPERKSSQKMQTRKKLDWSARGKPRIVAITALGTLVCIAVAFAIDSYSLESGNWRWGSNPINNVIIPLVLAPPFFLFLLAKLRELAIAHHELMNVAATDGLTSCLNRRAFTAMVEGYLQKVSRDEARNEGALLVIDVDHFKEVNDRFGHHLGDEVLQLIARSIKGAVREIDLVGRIGGEEFGVFMPGIDKTKIAPLAERIRLAINDATFNPDGESYRLSASIGGAAIDRQPTFSELYREADQQLYSAKRAGRNRVEIFPPPQPTVGAAVAATVH
jgi:diguanylate cyclase